MSNQIIRISLIISVIIVVLIALISFIIISWKIYKKKKEIQWSQIQIKEQLKNNENEIKMLNREDFGKPVEELQKLIINSINHEIVEFCINTAIRNNYKNILLTKNVEIYESIAISNKAEANVTILKQDFLDLEKYKNLIKNNKIIEHNLKIVDNIDQNNEFDTIMCLNSTKNFEQIFIENEKYLKKGGMFIFANTKSNKKSVKELIKQIHTFNYRYDNINWYTGFITIVKSS